MSSNRRIYGPGGSYAHMYAPRPLSHHLFLEWRTAGIVLSFFVRGIGRAWMLRGHSERVASRSTARTICAGSPRAKFR